MYENRIAVTTFENRTGDPALNNMGRITADWIVQGLVETELVSVVPVIDSVIAGSQIQTLALETQAQFIISGYYDQQDEQLQFHAQIYDAKKRDVLKAIGPVTSSSENPSEMIGLVQQRTMGGLVSAIDPRFKSFTGTLFETPKYEALREYAIGMDFFISLDWDDAIKHFNKAVELEPGFVVPLLASAWAYYNSGKYAKADSLVQRIRSIENPLGSSNRYSLECLSARLKGDFSSALKASRKQASVLPTQGNYLQIAFDALWCNRPHEAIKNFKKIDPLGQFGDLLFYWTFWGFSYNMIGDHQKELDLARKCREKFPDYLGTYYYELRALAALGKVDDVHALLDESLELPSQHGWTHGRLMRSTAEELLAFGFNNAAQKVLKRAIDWYFSRPIEERQPGLASSLCAT